MKELLKGRTTSLFLIVLAIYIVAIIIGKPVPDNMTSMIQVLFPMVAFKEAHRKHVDSQKEK